RGRFIAVVYFCFLAAPIRFLRYQWAYFKVNTLGKGRNVYVERAAAGASASDSMPRLATALGFLYIIGLYLVLRAMTRTDRADLLAPAGLVGIALLALVIPALPEKAVFQSPLRQ